MRGWNRVVHRFGHDEGLDILRRRTIDADTPGRVTITRPNGLTTYVDPVTREERDQAGQLRRVVPLAGFNSPGDGRGMPLAPCPKAPWWPRPDPGPNRPRARKTRAS